MNSLNLSFGKELKNSYVKKSFLLLNSMFKKMKTINSQKNLIVCALPETEDHISFKWTFPLYIIWKPLVLEIFRWLERVAWNE